MTSDDQYFLDLLASVPSDIASYARGIADYIEKHSDSLAIELRDAIDSATWLPESMRPPVRSLSSRLGPPAPPKGLMAKTAEWMSQNRTAIAVALAFAGTTAILMYRRKRAHARKRRARRHKNGTKKEIVVLAGSSLDDPLTRTLALDLDRRGYVVYITVSSTEEDRLVQSEKGDVRTLWMELGSSVPNPGLDIHPNLEPLRQLIKPSSRSSSPGSDNSSQSATHPHTLAGLVLLPGLTGYPTGPLATIPPSDLVDTINTRLISPILTVQQLLPLLTLAESQSHLDTPSSSPSSATPQPPPSIILAYHSIPTSLYPPNQTPEILTTALLSSLSRSIRRELPTSSRIRVTELKLGIFDLGSTHLRAPKAGEYVYPHHIESDPSQGPQPSRNSALTHWHSSQRAAAQRLLQGPPPAQNPSGGSSSNNDRTSGSSLREFHNAVFDSLHPGSRFNALGMLPWGGGGGSSLRGGRGGIVYVGQGARLYDFVGKWVPDGLVGWMIRRQERKMEKESEKNLGGAAGGADPAVRKDEKEGEGEGEAAPRWGFGSAGSSGSEVWEEL